MEFWLDKIVTAIVGFLVGLLPFLKVWWEKRQKDREQAGREDRQYSKGRRDEAQFTADYYQRIQDDRDARHDADIERYRRQIERDQEASEHRREKLARLEELQEEKNTTIAELRAEITQLKARVASDTTEAPRPRR